MIFLSLAIPTPAPAAPDDLALPVRKGEKTSSRTTKPNTYLDVEPSASRHSERKSTSKKRSSDREEHSKSSSSSRSHHSERASSSEQKSRSDSDRDKPSSRKSAASRDKDSEKSAEKRETEKADRSESASADHSDRHNSDAPASLPEADLPVASASPPRTFTGTAFSAPSSRAPANGSGEGFLHKLFHLGRDSSVRPTVYRQTFNSDYATRSGNAPIPVSFNGSGMHGTDLPIGGEDAYRFATLPTSFCPTDLTLLPTAYCLYGNPIYLRREAAASMDRMIAAAAAEGITLRVVSGYRDYNHQLRLYQSAVARKGENQKAVARPGKSEHQLGTAADVSNDDAHALDSSFANTPAGRWIAANAMRYGWELTVVSGSGPNRHVDEPWHIRYLGSSVGSKSPYSIVQRGLSAPRKSIFSSLKHLFGK